MTRKASYLGLDLIRFAAAALVMTYHLGYKAFLTHGPFGPYPPIEAFGGGWVGVPIFFVLSGFVIAFSASGKPTRQFIVSRAARLYPAAWICASITSLFVMRTDPYWLKGYIGSLVLSPVGPWISGVYWTLGVEICFYTMVAVWLATVGSSRLLLLGMILGAVSSAFWFGRTALFLFGLHLSSVIGDGPGESWIDMLLLLSGCYFSLGIMLWSAATDGWTRGKVGMAALTLASSTIAVVAKARFLVADDGNPHVVMATLTWLVAVAGIAATAHWNDWLHSRFGHWAGTARTIGLLTYPLYLVHAELGMATIKAIHQIGQPASVAISFIVALVVSFCVMKMERYPRALIMKVASKGLGIRARPA